MCIYTPYINPAGSLILAEGGVCLVGSLGQYKTDMRDTLQRSKSVHKAIVPAPTPITLKLSFPPALETEQLLVRVPGCLSHEEPQVLSWPLCCSVWATSHPQHHRNRAFVKADVELLRAHSMHETSNISKALAE